MGRFEHDRAVSELLHKAVFALDGYAVVSMIVPKMTPKILDDSQECLLA